MEMRVPIWEKHLLTIDEAATYTNIGQNRISKLLKNLLAHLCVMLVEKNL